MNKSKERHYTISQAARAAGINPNTLRNACANGRIPHSRSETGYRLISQRVVQALKDKGLATFPRPVLVEPVKGSENEGFSISDFPDRLGLLGAPSEELQRQKENAEAAKMRVEQARAEQELEDIHWKRNDASRQRAEQHQAIQVAQKEESKMEAASRREEAEARQQLEAEQARRQERRKWIERLTDLAWSRLRSRACSISYRFLDDLNEDLHPKLAMAIAEEAQGLSPGCPWRTEDKAMDRAVDTVLQPYEHANSLEKLASRALKKVPTYLQRLQNDGFIPSGLRDDDLRLYAQRVEPRVRAALEERGRLGPIDEKQAQRIVEETLDTEIGFS